MPCSLSVTSSASLYHLTTLGSLHLRHWACTGADAIWEFHPRRSMGMSTQTAWWLLGTPWSKAKQPLVTSRSRQMVRLFCWWGDVPNCTCLAEWIGALKWLHPEVQGFKGCSQSVHLDILIPVPKDDHLMPLQLSFLDLSTDAIRIWSIGRQFCPWLENQCICY